MDQPQPCRFRSVVYARWTVNGNSGCPTWVIRHTALAAAPDAKSASRPSAALFNHVIGARQQRFRQLPAIYPFFELVEAGGLMAYAFDLAELNRRAANDIDAILRGARHPKRRRQRSKRSYGQRDEK